MATIASPDASSQNGAQQQASWPWLGKLIPYYRDPSRVLVLKLDIYLLVWAFMAGLLKDMDQSSTTAAFVSGMKESLSLYGNELVEFTTYFSIGYALFIVPSQMIQTRMRPSLWLPFCEIVWGAITLVIYRAQNAQTVFVLRFFLGVFEATSWPGIVNLIFNWYTPSELGVRLAIFGVSSVAGNMFLGTLQAALYRNMNGVNGLEGWQWLFIISGIITMVWGFVGLFIIPDSPSHTRALYLTPHERQLARERMSDSSIKTSSHRLPAKILFRRIRQTFQHPVSYLFLAIYLQYAWAQRANSYFLLYLKDVKDPSTGQPLYSVYNVNLIPIGGYALSMITTVGLNFLSDRYGWRWQVSCGAAFVHLIATAVLAAWPGTPGTTQQHAIIMTFYFLTFTTAAWGYASLAWIAEILRREPEARAILVGATVTLVYVGHATIPLRAWRVSDSPRYPVGFPLAAAFSFGSIVAMLSMKIYVDRNPEIMMRGFSKKDGESDDAEDGYRDEPTGEEGSRLEGVVSDSEDGREKSKSKSTVEVR